ncbi:hypothetical protein L204_105274 [Cryptococcus depauperatus]
MGNCGRDMFFWAAPSQVAIMSSPFPQLLRKANIATYDPLITRIYTTTPSSLSRHADWGLKFSIPRSKGPRYIKFSALDSGPGFDCDWRSAEREARFIQAWGSGKVNWELDGEKTEFRTQFNDFRNGRHDDEMVEPIVKQEEWVRDVESMSEKEFEKYLEELRAEGKRYLRQELQLPESSESTIVHPEDRSLVHLSIAGHLTESLIPTLQVSLQSSHRSSVNSTQIYSNPHKLQGLTYAQPPDTSNDYNQSTSLPARAINSVNRHEDAWERGSLASAATGSNQPWVVSVGGLTGKTNKANVDSRSYLSNGDIHGVDFSRQDEKSGTYRVKVTGARLKSGPTVLALAESGAGRRWNGRRRVNGASMPSALDKFTFELNVAPITEELEVGSPEWITKEPAVYPITFGGPKHERDGKDRQRLNEQQLDGRQRVKQGREDSVIKVKALLDRFKKSRQH